MTSTYRLLAGPLGSVLQRAVDGAVIPPDQANADYRDYLDWTALGNVPDPVPTPPPQVVTSVRPVALRRALRQTLDPTGAHPNALEYVVAALASSGLADARDAFEYSVVMDRDDLLGLCGLLGFSVPQVDAVLTLAATYPGADATYATA